MTSNAQLPEPLSGKDKDSFAFTTLAIRLPVIITKVIDSLCRYRRVLPGKLKIDASEHKAAEEETKSVIQELAKLKYELQTNKPFVELHAALPDTKLYNQFLADESKRTQEVTWFNVPWLYAECYFYRRQREILFNSKYYKRYDQFDQDKHDSFASCKDQIVRLAQKLEAVAKNLETANAKDLFHIFLMASLYSNKFDLSFSTAETLNQEKKGADSLEAKILSNHFPELWNYIETLSKRQNKTFRIDIVLDNAGYELFTDLVLLEFLHASKLFPREKTRVYLHVKTIPWFVSDTMTKDITWMLQEIQENEDFKDVLKVNGSFLENIANGVWTVEKDTFWCLPCDFTRMAELAPKVYKQLSSSDLVIFKGDLNYRKLVGDLKWDFETPFNKALRGFNPPTALCVLRTMKSQTVAGIDDPQVLEQIRTKFPVKWASSGEYALVQFIDFH